MTWLQIRPQDVWLFRDGKPFSGGEDHAATGIFPPTPFTVQGALRQIISMLQREIIRPALTLMNPSDISASTGV
jgi:CRISPR/Cas system CMR-associated protein Cmr3 (group 5 of RAMP superfamily)